MWFAKTLRKWIKYSCFYNKWFYISIENSKICIRRGADRDLPQNFIFCWPTKIIVSVYLQVPVADISLWDKYLKSPN